MPNNVRPKGELARKYYIDDILNCCLIIKLLKLMTSLVVYSCASFFLSSRHFLFEYYGVSNNITAVGNIVEQIKFLLLTFAQDMLHC